MPRSKDVESAPMTTESSIPAPPPNSMQLAQLGNAAVHGEDHRDPREEPVSATSQEAGETSTGMHQVDSPPQTNTADHGASRVPTSSREIVPECIGRETCPICIVDFEEGDDLRVLPCEGKHRFHQSCVDPWLLELSGSCPICRQGKTPFGRLGNRRLTRTHQTSVRWRQSYPEGKTRLLQPTVIANQVHLYSTIVGFLVTCDLRLDASEEVAPENRDLHRPSLDRTVSLDACIDNIEIIGVFVSRFEMLYSHILALDAVDVS